MLMLLLLQQSHRVLCDALDRGHKAYLLVKKN